MTDNSDERALLDLLNGGDRGVLVTIKRDGGPQLSNVDYAYDPAGRVLRFSVTDGRAKTVNLRRDPRASFHVTTAQGWSYAVAEGNAVVFVMPENNYEINAVPKSAIDDLHFERMLDELCA
jgi:PPOX class probable F420-dependent enzyme